MFKRVISILISAALLLTSVTSVLAGTSASVPAIPASNSNEGINENNVTITRDKARNIALQSLKDFLEIEIDEKKFENRITLRQNYDIQKKYVWEINYNYNNNDKSISYFVVINADTGKVNQIRSNEYKNNGEQSAISKISEDEAKIIAENFLKKVNPKEFGSLKFINNPYQANNLIGAYNVNYAFRYIRVVDGIEFENNSVTVEVDGSTGKVKAYIFNWDEDINLPSASGVIAKEKAAELIKQGTDFKLRYTAHRNKYDYNEKPNEILLIYSPDYPNGPFIDAKDGKSVNWNYTSMEQLGTKDITAEKKDEIFKGAKVIQPLAKEIDTSRATQVIKEQLELLMGTGYEIDNLQYSEGINNWIANVKKSWTAQFYKKNSNGTRDFRSGGQIAIDALTEEVVGLNNHSYFGDMSESFEPKITWDQAYDKAIELIAKYSPSEIKNINTEQKHYKRSYNVNGKDMGERFYYFNFQRIVNGIPYQDNQINITYDAATGSLTEYRKVWDETIKFPNPQEAMPKSDVEKIYYDQMETKLIYILLNKSKDQSKPEAEAKLVYAMRPIEYNQFVPYGNINAVTGRFADYYGDELKGNENTFKKQIQGHWAEKELSILAYHGIIDTKEFSLEKEMTRMDAVKMLVNAKGYRPYILKDMEALKFSNIQKDTDDYRYLQLAARYGIVNNLEGEFNGIDKVTREQMAEMIVNLLGYNKLSKAKNIFTVPYTDANEISESLYGAVAIGTGLDIFTGDAGRFRPKDNVTFEEFSVAVYKALNSIRSVEK